MPARSTESVWLRRELASSSKFGQDLAAPAACQHHLSPQPVPLPVPPCYIVPGPPAASPARGGTCVQARSTFAARRDPHTHSPNPRCPLPMELHRVQGAGTGWGGSCQKKPTARLADPRHSAQTRFPFYFRNMRQLSLGDKRPQAGSCSSAQHLPERAGMESQRAPSAASSLQGLWEPTLLEIPAMSGAATLPG